MIYTHMREAAERCLQNNIPFALYRMPGEGEMRFVACSPDDVDDCGLDISHTVKDDTFFISFFCDDCCDAIAIRPMLSVSDILAIPAGMPAYPDADIHPVDRSTPYMYYYAQVHELLSSLDATSKTVLSRIIAVTSTRDLVDVAMDYFDMFPEAMRYLFFTQSTGIWLGASPELLLDYDIHSGHVATMSLAGTRKSTDAEESWSDKNAEEQNIVTRYIEQVFRQHGLDPEVSEAGVRRFRNIEHRCNNISAEGYVNLPEFINALNPTPAIAGYPRAKAIEQIDNLEIHSRHCYGGWIGTATDSRVRLYVNLRCAFVSSVDRDGRRLYNIYAGGGITSMSNASDEWAETTQKAQSIFNVINGTTSVPVDDYQSIDVSQPLA